MTSEDIKHQLIIITHAVILTDSVSFYKRWNGETQTRVCQWSTSTFENSCGCTALDIPEWREMTERIDWREKQPSQATHTLEDLMCWEVWDIIIMRVQSQGHHTIARHLEERGVKKRRSARRSSLNGRERAIVNQTNIGTVSKAMLGNLLRDGVERIWAFPSAYIPSWTELNWTAVDCLVPRVMTQIF